MGKPNGMRPLGTLNIGGRIILKWILDGMEWYGLVSPDSGWGPAESSCEQSNDPSGSIKFWEILE
jgi:hypothetical protein